MIPFQTFFPILLNAVLALIGGLALYNWRVFKELFSKIPPRAWLILFLIFIFSLGVRFFVIPHTHYVFYDEYAHINVAQNILHSGKFCACEFGTRENCQVCKLRPWPGGFQNFLSLSMALFGDSDSVAFGTNAFLGSFSVLIVFFVVYLWFDDWRLALGGAAVFSLIPVHLKFPGSAALGIASVFFLLLTLLFQKMFMKRKQRFSLFLLFLSSLLYTVHVRPENILLVGILPLSFLVRDSFSAYIEKLDWKRIVPAAVLFLVLLFPLLQFYYWGAVDFESAGWSDSLQEKLSYFKEHIGQNLFFFINLRVNSLFFVGLVLAGMVRLFITNKYELLYWFLFFSGFIVLYSSYHIGNITGFVNSGGFLLLKDTVRYSLILYLPLLFLVIHGFEWVSVKSYFQTSTVICLVIIVMVAMLMFRADFVFREDQLHSPGYEFVKSKGRQISDDVPIVAMNPSIIFATIDKKAVESGVFLNKLNGKAKKAVLLKAHWWDEQRRRAASVKEKLKRYYQFEVIVKEQGYEFVKLRLKDWYR